MSLGFQAVIGAFATILVTGCGGGGCSSGCGGSSVIPGGFPKDQRVTNAAGVRVTRAGLDFIQSNLGSVITKVLSSGGGTVKGGVMTFPIPQSDGKFKNPIPFLPDISYTICDGGPKPDEDPPKCVVEINIAAIKNVKLNANAPHDLNIDATVPVKLRNLPIKVAGISATAGLGVGAADACGTLDYVDVPVQADVSLENIPDDATHAARAGYTKINIAKMTFNDTPIKDNFKFCGSGIGTSILNLLKPLIVGFISGGLTSKLSGPLQNATCMKAQKLDDGTLQCPTATFNRGGTCRYADDDAAECVPMLLGLESRFDLSGLLASLSPGTSGGLDFMLASGGDMDPAPGTDVTQNGITLDMLGGALPHPLSTCVPHFDNPLPTGIMIPDELKGNTITPWGGAEPPHLAFGLAERYLNHAAAGAYNSGLLCIGISTEQIPQLDGALFKVLLPSIEQLSDKFQSSDTHPSMALSIRPQKPPVITVGDNTADFKSPLLDVNMKDTDLDFYMWSENRYVRLFTGRIDLHIPMNLEPTKDGLAIKLPGKSPIEFTNPRVSNNGILLEDDKGVGSLVQSLGSLIPTTALSNIKPFKLDSALAPLGLKMTIPDGGIRKLTKGTDRFLAIFASLEVASSAVPTTRTTAAISRLDVDARNYRLETFGQIPPVITVHADADLDNGMREVEYAYKVDQGMWTTFEKGRDFSVSSPLLALQGKHTIAVVSRVHGVVESEGEPVVVPVVIDVDPPQISVQNAGPGLVRIVTDDVVAMPEELKVEARIDGGSWFPVVSTLSTHGKVAERVVPVGIDAQSLEVRAEDPSGNVGTSTSALIRGRADGAVIGKAGCGCNMPGTEGNGTTSNGLATLGAAVAIGAVIERRRRRLAAARAMASASMLVLGAGSAGCTCAGGAGDNAPPAPADDRKPVVPYVIGSYTSAIATADGKVWVAGYYEGDPSTGNSSDFSGDLVVGQLSDDGSIVKWATVDGVPAVAPTRNANGFRGGITDQGDDVGLYTAIALDSKGNPLVVYHDRTNGTLRAAHYDGNAWSSHVIDQVDKGFTGRWASLTMVSGNPVVAYQSIEPSAGGYSKARVRVARASTDAPGSTADWTTEDVVVDDQSPCLAELCDTGTKCLVAAAATGVLPICASTISGCDASCTDACVKNPKDGTPLCAKAKASPSPAGFVNALGSYVSIASNAGGALGLVFYDRVHGNLRGSTSSGGKWVTTPATAPLDGWVGDAAKDKGKGDRGIGATLAIDASGNWHIGYVDGVKESLLYMNIPGGDFSKASAPVIVDDGTNEGGTVTFPDGLHIIGDDSSISVSGSAITLVYQDATSGTLRYAKGPVGPAPKFTRGVLKQDGFGGFWPHVVGQQVVNFYRMRGNTVDNAGGTPDVIRGDVRALPLP